MSPLSCNLNRWLQTNFPEAYEKFSSSTITFSDVGKIGKTAETLVDVETAERIATKLKDSIALSPSEVSDLIRMSPESTKNLEKLEKAIERIYRITSDKKFGFAEDCLESVKEFNEVQKKALSLYEKYCKITTDVSQISKNTGISPNIIQSIKKHMFFDKHLLETRAGTYALIRFDPDLTQALAWERLAVGNFVQSDLTLLLHEFIESLIMKRGKIILQTDMKYKFAHNIANMIHNWEKTVR